MTERIQKALAQAGVGSRRQVELWIREGRLSVNGEKAMPGTRVGPGDRLSLDGRPVRMQLTSSPQTVAYHRPQKNAPRSGEAAGMEMPAQLASISRQRWVAISPLPPGDGGLELLTTDGNLSYALTRRFSELHMEFALRLLGDPRLDQLERMKAGTVDEGPALRIASLELEGGEGANRWFRLSAQGVGGRDVRRLCEAAGLKLNRLIRVALGPVKMDRHLSRGRTLALEPLQIEELYALAGLSVPESQSAPPAGRSGGKRRGQPGGKPRRATRKAGSTGSRNARR